MEGDKCILAYLLPNSSRSRSLALAVSGVLAVGLGGYLIYKNLAKSIKEATLMAAESKLNGQQQQQQPPVDPHSSRSSDYSINSPGSKVKTTSPRSHLLEKAMQIKMEGNQLFKAEKYAEAWKCYDEAIEICPKEHKLELATFYQNRAAAYEKLNELEKAYDDCSAALKLNPRYIKALYRRGDLCEKMQRLYDAMQDFMKCCIFENFLNMETSQRADFALRNLSQKMAKEYMQARGDRFLPFSHCTIKDMLNSYACDPVITPHLKVKGANRNSNLQLNVAAGRDDNDDYSSSVMTNGYSDSDQDEPLTGYRKAVYCLVNRQYDRIIDACTEEIEHFEQSTHFIHCLLLRATFYYFKGQFKKSEADLAKVFDILKDKDDYEDSSRKFLCAAHIKMSWLEHQKGNVDGCLAHLTEAEKIMPLNPDVYSLRGQVYSYTRDYAKANVDFARCVQLRPDFAHFAVQLATAELKTATETEDNHQALPQVIRNFEDMVRKFPDSAEANLIYAQILCDAAQFDTAIKYFDKAQKLDPNNPNIFAQRALLEVYYENNDGMLQLLDQALKLDPCHMMALEIQAQYHCRRNDVPKMMESYEKAMQMARNETEVAHLIAMRETTLCQIQVAEDVLIGA